MKQKTKNEKKGVPVIKVNTSLKAGYRPVHGLVAPDGWTRWVPGWFDLDSQGRYAVTGSPPPPPEQ